MERAKGKLMGFCEWCEESVWNYVVIKGRQGDFDWEETICLGCKEDSFVCPNCGEIKSRSLHKSENSDTCYDCDAKKDDMERMLDQTVCYLCDNQVDVTDKIFNGRLVCSECVTHMEEKGIWKF